MKQFQSEIYIKKLRYICKVHHLMYSTLLVQKTLHWKHVQKLEYAHCFWHNLLYSVWQSSQLLTPRRNITKFYISFFLFIFNQFLSSAVSKNVPLLNTPFFLKVSWFYNSWKILVTHKVLFDIYLFFCNFLEPQFVYNGKVKNHEAGV